MLSLIDFIITSDDVAQVQLGGIAESSQKLKAISSKAAKSLKQEATSTGRSSS
jgi:hypothetical protein